MYKKIRFAIAAATAAVLAQTSRADLVTGQFNFSGSAFLDGGSVFTATGVMAWNNVNYPSEITSGSFTSITPSTTMTFSTNTWNLNTTVPITNFWNAGGFRFEIQSSQITSRMSGPFGYGSMAVSGFGMVSGNGYTPTVCRFIFTTQDPSASSPPYWLYSCAFSAVATTTNGEPVLTGAATPNGIVLSWSDPTFSLQAAPTVNGYYTNIPSAVSPYTNACAGSSQYFRLQQ